MNKKKVFIIILFTTLLIAIAVGIYFGLQNVSDVIVPSPSPSGFPTTPSSGSPGLGGDEYKGPDTFSEEYTEEVYSEQKENLSIVSDRSTELFWVYEGEETEIFFISDGIVYVVSESGESVVGNIPRTDPYRVIRNIDGSSALVLFEYGSALFDSEKRAWNILPYSFYSASFSPEGDVIAFSNVNNGEIEIFTASVDSLDKVTVYTRIHAYDLVVDWLSSSVLIAYSSPSYDFSGNGWSINMKTNRVEKLFSGKGLDVLTNPQNKLVSRFVSQSPLSMKVDVFSTEGSSAPSTLPFSTLSSKCSFYSDNASLICGVPYVLNKESGVRLPDSYMQRDLYTKDEIYRMTFEGSLQTELLFGAQDVSLDIFNPVALDNFFYFINRLDSKLYRLDISHE